MSTFHQKPILGAKEKPVSATWFQQDFKNRARIHFTFIYCSPKAICTDCGEDDFEVEGKQKKSNE